MTHVVGTGGSMWIKSVVMVQQRGTKQFTMHLRNTNAGRYDCIQYISLIIIYAATELFTCLLFPSAPFFFPRIEAQPVHGQLSFPRCDGFKPDAIWQQLILEHGEPLCAVLHSWEACEVNCSHPLQLLVLFVNMYQYHFVFVPVGNFSLATRWKA